MSLIICVECKKEMICTCTGKTVVYNGSHCYGGDEFSCSNCENKIIVCSGQPYYCHDAAKTLPKTFVMEK